MNAQLNKSVFKYCYLQFILSQRYDTFVNALSLVRMFRLCKHQPFGCGVDRLVLAIVATNTHYLTIVLAKVHNLIKY